MLIFPLIAVLALFADQDLDARKRRRPKETCFDQSGVKYHERLTAILEPPCRPQTYYAFLPVSNGDSLQYVKQNHVRTMTCDHYGRTDTLQEASTLHPGQTHLVYHQRGFHSRMVWDFDTTGRVQRFVQYRDTVEQEVQFSQSYRYDDGGYLVQSTDYTLSDGISKQYDGYTETGSVEYQWSADHRICDVQYSRSVVSLPGTSKSDRKQWDKETTAIAHWEFDSIHRPIHYIGNRYGQRCSVYFTYDTTGHLSTRKTEFLDCTGSFTDSIAWSATNNGWMAVHYFAVTVNERLFFTVLETLWYDPGDNVVAAELHPGVIFPGERFRYLRGRTYKAVYDGSAVKSEEESNNDAHNFLVKRTYATEQHADRAISTCTWMETDSSRADTIRVVKTYALMNGLITAVDVFNRDRVWWRGTWYFPAYFDLDERECYRLRYTYYH